VLIAAANTFISFMHFTFGQDYLEYLESPDEMSQRQLIRNPDKDTCVDLQRTRWYDLGRSEDRKKALCLVMAIPDWHRARQALRHHGGDEDDDIEMSAYSTPPLASQEWFDGDPLNPSTFQGPGQASHAGGSVFLQGGARG
jgi:hypothetical protein